MKYLKPILGIIGLLLVIYLGDSKLGQLPPLMKFFDPYHGFWQNAVAVSAHLPSEVMLEGVSAECRVVMDERGVPHIFASNEHDLYFLQGYLTAQDRLWQMEFQTHAAAGRLSEIIGERTLEFDLEQRRIGMVWAAERALEYMANDTASMQTIQAYTDGVNAFINTLKPQDFPLEYKLLDYAPEQWTLLKSSLLLKYMAKMLNDTERDRPNTEAFKLLGEDGFYKLFPDQQYLDDPVVPDFAPDTSRLNVENGAPHLSDANWETQDIQPHFVGSNNWAVSGARTESGYPILCNDPHLRLTLPSIWYEVQLNAPGINCYGVSLPGSPGVTIGFNDSIAWGVTNAGRDVKNYFALELNEDGSRYSIGHQEHTIAYRVETVKVRGKADVLDTVKYTVYGPIPYSDDSKNEHLALRWIAHDPSNELKCFYLLNRAGNHSDYTEALSHYRCPGQNFVYADARNNIAIWQQGKFNISPKNYGRFVMNGNEEGHLTESFIPQRHNPNMLNPARGFVSSANQAPTDTAYPYYYSGVYEEFRNRTINRFLRADSSVSVQDMKDLQLSNKNLLAEEALPILLDLLDTADFQYKEYETLALNELREWDFSNDKELIAPTVFEIWWDELNNLIWDEFNAPEWDQDMYYRYSWEELMKSGKAKIDMRDPRYVYPNNKVTLALLKDEPNSIYFDHRSSNNSLESAKDIVYDSFYWTAMKFGDIIKYKYNRPHWGHYQGTGIQHLARIDAFSSKKLFVGGSEHAPNATTSTHGPSWRMIVELRPDGPVAHGVLPGGQSGNPGSPFYLNSLQKWVDGDYNTLHFLRSAEEQKPEWRHINFKPFSP